jgi:hypothetical protein
LAPIRLTGNNCSIRLPHRRSDFQFQAEQLFFGTAEPTAQ